MQLNAPAEIAVTCLGLLTVLGLTRLALGLFRAADDETRWDDEPALTLTVYDLEEIDHV